MKAPETAERGATAGSDARLTADIAEVQRLCGALGRRVQIMEVCGTHTVSIFRTGIRALLPANLRLISGPGCPVCVTAQRYIDAALELACRPNVTIATYGDMLRVPGRRGSLEQVRAGGADVRVVSSSMTAIDLAERLAPREVVFLGVGFETTAPATAAAVMLAERHELVNFSVLAAHKLVVPAMQALLSADAATRDPRTPRGIDGFLCPGHVSVIIGASAYEPIVREHRVPCVIAGFEPAQIWRGLAQLMRQIAGGEPRVENVYPAVVSEHGNRYAQGVLRRVFEVADAAWRELGVIPRSGLELAPRYQRFDAVRRFEITLGADEDHPACLCGQVIQGRVEPPECGLFGDGCTPLHPIGPCMVSSEGTCAAWYRYGARGAAATGRRS
ncbi:MAG: Hydrogenase maturation factor HypD [Phycisphaerae bacterium]|nr:Hydrogenase maturation factor HypD [Phycisphaerae bacterium]